MHFFLSALYVGFFAILFTVSNIYARPRVFSNSSADKRHLEFYIAPEHRSFIHFGTCSHALGN
jgi:hypothetical protein